MSKEAMKLALEHAKRDERHLNHAETRYWCRMYRDIAEKAVEALANPDFWEGYVPEPVKPAQQEFVLPGGGYVPAIPAQQTLDKKAENAREQPAQKCSYPYCGCNSKAWCKVERNEALDKKAENARELGLDYEPAQQEPVAYLCENAVGHKYFRWKKPSSTYKPIALYTSPPAQRTWVNLTPQNLNEIFKVANTGEGAVHLALKLIKEKNT